MRLVFNTSISTTTKSGHSITSDYVCVVCVGGVPTNLMTILSVWTVTCYMTYLTNHVC